MGEGVRMLTLHTESSPAEVALTLALTGHFQEGCWSMNFKPKCLGNGQRRGFLHMLGTLQQPFFVQSNSAVCQSKVLRLTDHRHPLLTLLGHQDKEGRKWLTAEIPSDKIKWNKIIAKKKKKKFSTLASFQIHCVPFYAFTWISRRHMQAAMRREGYSCGSPWEPSIHRFYLRVLVCFPRVFLIGRDTSYMHWFCFLGKSMLNKSRVNSTWI